MRKLIISLIITGMLIFGMSMGVMADTTSDETTVGINVSAIATLGIIDTTPASFTIIVPTTAGAIPIVSGADTSTTLAYTSVIASGSTNVIKASIASLIPGLTLNISCGSVANGSYGSGTPTSFDLVVAASDLVTLIGSGYTGAVGATITYTLSISDINAVVASGSTNNRTVTFTIAASGV